jgi:hypothetical protein
MRAGWIAIVCLLSIGVGTASAQNGRFGGKVGMTASDAVFESLDDDPGYGNRVFVSGGGFYVQPITGPLALQLEALFMAKGGEYGDDSTQTTYTLMLDYLEIPALARINVVRRSSHSIYLFGGPAVDFRINAKFRTAAGRPVRSGVNEDISSTVNLFDLSMTAGGGVDIGRHAVVDARYSWGLTDLNKDATDGHGVRNRALTVMAGFRY